MQRALRYVSVGTAVRGRRMAQRLRYGGRQPSVCDDVAEWAARHQQATAVPLLAPRPVTRRPPHTIEPSVLPEYTSRMTATQHGRYLVPVHDARIVGREGLVILPDNSYAAEYAYGPKRLRTLSDYRAPRRQRTVHKTGSYFPLLVMPFASPWNYYHWLHDTMMRYSGVADVLPDDTRIVVSPNLAPFQRETLRRVGIPDERLVTFDAREVWELETLYFTAPASNPHNSRSEPCAWLADTLRRAFGVTDTTPRRRLFLSRRDADLRRIVNEDAVEGLLRDHGFETIVPSELDLGEQVATFAAAEAVVAPHGAALTNILFAPSGPTVVEFIDPQFASNANTYWSLSEALDHDYWYFLAESVAAPRSQPDLHVPLDKLEATLARALRRPLAEPTAPS